MFKLDVCFFCGVVDLLVGCGLGVECVMEEV